MFDKNDDGTYTATGLGIYNIDFFTYQDFLDTAGIIKKTISWNERYSFISSKVKVPKLNEKGVEQGMKSVMIIAKYYNMLFALTQTNFNVSEAIKKCKFEYMETRNGVPQPVHIPNNDGIIENSYSDIQKSFENRLYKFISDRDKKNKLSENK